MTAEQLSVQSDHDDSMPYITVERDDRGGACWLVVGRDSSVRCYSGHHAIAVMEMLCRSKGIPTP
jgi:hypothetical protein